MRIERARVLESSFNAISAAEPEMLKLRLNIVFDGASLDLLLHGFDCREAKAR